MAGSVNRGATSRASSTMPPWMTSTETLDSMTPMPIALVKRMDEIKSSADLA